MAYLRQRWLWRCLVLPLTYASIVIPRPNGMYGIGSTVMELVDTSRFDPLAPTAINRSVVVSAFYPVAPESECEWTNELYMPSKTAAYADLDVADLGVPKGTFESFRLQMCSEKDPRGSSADRSHSRFPVVLFSPASGTGRLYYSAMAQEVASHGFIVVTIDHPYDARIVEFPDGRIAKATIVNPGEKLATKLLQIRAKDVTFVVDSLENTDIAHQLLPHWHATCSPTRGGIAMYGHSAGGATALLSMVNESRIVGGFNLDGGLTGAEKPVVEHGLDNPFMFFQSAGWKKEGWTDQPWKHVWPHLEWKLWLRLKHSKHGTFTDVPLLAQLLGLDPKKVPAAAALIGTIPGDRAMEVISTYVVGFLNFVFTSREDVLLQQPSASFPEVIFIRS